MKALPLLLALAFVASCQRSEPQTKTAPPPPVPVWVDVRIAHKPAWGSNNGPEIFAQRFDTASGELSEISDGPVALRLRPSSNGDRTINLTGHVTRETPFFSSDEIDISEITVIDGRPTMHQVGGYYFTFTATTDRALASTWPVPHHNEYTAFLPAFRPAPVPVLGPASAATFGPASIPEGHYVLAQLIARPVSLSRAQRPYYEAAPSPRENTSSSSANFIFCGTFAPRPQNHDSELVVAGSSFAFHGKDSAPGDLRRSGRYSVQGNRVIFPMNPDITRPSTFRFGCVDGIDVLVEDESPASSDSSSVPPRIYLRIPAEVQDYRALNQWCELLIARDSALARQL